MSYAEYTKRRCEMKQKYELIPMPDFKRSHVTNHVLEQDRKTMARIRDSERMRGSTAELNKRNTSK